jgi:hypothetical protein
MTAMAPFADILQSVDNRVSYQLRMAESLARIIADLLNDNEPLLRATRDGTEITVSEKGGPLMFTVTIERSETLG